MASSPRGSSIPVSSRKLQLVDELSHFAGRIKRGHICANDRIWARVSLNSQVSNPVISLAQELRSCGKSSASIKTSSSNFIFYRWPAVFILHIFLYSWSPKLRVISRKKLPLVPLIAHCQNES